MKTPVAAVVGYAEVSKSHYAAPSTIWRNLGAMTGLEHKEFNSYFLGLSKAFALGLRNPRSLTTPIKLADIREHAANFQPPQFYLKVPGESLLQQTLAASLNAGQPSKGRSRNKSAKPPAATSSK